jgi:uncharacterized protein
VIWGGEVSANELSRQLGIAVKSVQRYLDLLEKAFVVTRLGGLSRNLRKEVTSKAKYYLRRGHPKRGDQPIQPPGFAR